MTDLKNIIEQAREYAGTDEYAGAVLLRQVAAAADELGQAFVRERERADAALATLEKVRRHMKVIRGAQWDMLGRRPDMDAAEEIAVALAGIESDVSEVPARKAGE